MTQDSQIRHYNGMSRRMTWLLVGALLLLLWLQLFALSRCTSMSWDEGHHLFDGYTVLKHADFDLNPEVPPIAKIVAALPLLPLQLVEPVQQGRPSQLEAFLDGKDFLFHNDADRLLLRGRLAIALFTVLLALTVFVMAEAMFDTLTGLLALAFFVFDPNLLAHGALVTTDAAITCFVLASVFTWWRYTREPSARRLLLAGLLVGLAVATKFTGLFLIPTIALLVLWEAAANRSAALLRRRALAFGVTLTVAYLVLWTSYGFRYAARPDRRQLNPTLDVYLGNYARVANPKPLALLSRAHVLPEAYLWGLANTKLTEDRNVSYLFGAISRHGTPLYFPAAFLIKSTLPLLFLLAIAVWAFFRFPKLRRRWTVLMVPVGVFFALAMHSSMNIGVRHLLPIYPFLYIIAASTLTTLIYRHRRWIISAAVLICFQAFTSLRCFPADIAYANEAWGGPNNVHRYLSDSNSDWGQQLKTVAGYLRDHQVDSCWLAYTASGVVDERYYGVSCRPLPTTVNLWWIPITMSVPDEIDATVLISDDELEGIDLPFGTPNPYAAFRTMKPVAILDGGLFVYQGRFDMSQASRSVAEARRIVHAKY
jgi:hypothetical protein